MKDRLKFRAWNSYQNKMFDVYQILYDCDLVCCISNEKTRHTFGVTTCDLMQCTGLKDKNGKLIFEGDILAGVNGSINGYPWKWGPVEVKWNDEDAKFQMWTGGTFEKQDSTHWFEVIGNIYENKDLLKDNE